MHSQNSKKLVNYYQDYHSINPALLLGLIIVTFGTYIIPWMYLKNKEFENLDKHAPESIRNPILMLVFPLSWAYIIYIIKILIFNNIFVQIIEIIGWIFIYFLIVKYVYDFCLCYGRITKTMGHYWFIMFFIGTIGVFGVIFNNYWVAPFTVFLIILIPSMQAELNSKFERHQMKEKTERFYQNMSK